MQILDFVSLDREGALRSGSDEGPMVAASSVVNSTAAELHLKQSYAYVVEQGNQNSMYEIYAPRVLLAGTRLRASLSAKGSGLSSLSSSPLSRVAVASRAVPPILPPACSA